MSDPNKSGRTATRMAARDFWAASSSGREPGVEEVGGSAIEVENLSFAYDGSPVLRNVSLHIADRDFACIVGPNGGGKTTLLKLLLGLLQPQRGRVRVLGVSPERARTRVGYMPQHAQLDPQFPVTVSEVVLMGRLGLTRWIGPFRRRDREAADAALKQVDLHDLRSRAFSQLSGGQRQRALIARAIVCEPRLLLLDEPTANLDPGVEDELQDLLRELNRRMTVVIVSHDVGFVSKNVNTVVCVNRDVKVHCADRLTGDVFRELYGQDVQVVQHAHDHTHDPGPHHHRH